MFNRKPAKGRAQRNRIRAPGSVIAAHATELSCVPLDPSFAEQKKIMLRCKGLFYACRGGAEARRFNRMLIDAGLVRGL